MIVSALESSGETIDVDDIATHYHEAGSGESVLLLHGSGPGVSAWANWQHTMAPLAENHHVLAPDIVGFGSSSRPDGITYSLQTWMDHVWGFLDAKGIERTSIVGNSLGGRIALGMAASHPERLNRMVLMGSPGLGMVPTEGLRALRAYEPSYGAMHDLLTKFFAFDSTIVTPELVQIRYEASIAPGAYEAYRAMFVDPKRAGIELGIDAEEVGSITTPTLIVHGREDRVIPLEVGVNMLKALPNADLHIFSRCGHWTQIERAAEFTGMVKEFL